jgi:hypothetical protein
MDVPAAKSALVRELGNHVRISGGPEAFRRLIGGPADVVNEALAELAAEGWLKQTCLRVGTVYHYPPNEKRSLDLIDEMLSRPAPEPAARPAPARPPPAPAAIPGPEAAQEERQAAVEQAAPALMTETPAGTPPVSTGPIRARKKSEMGAGGSPPSSAPADPPAASVPGGHTGPVRARKKSEMVPDAGGSIGGSNKER